MNRCARHVDEDALYPCADCATTPEPIKPTAQRIAECAICDDQGRLANGLRCHHDPVRYAAAERGVAAARAILERSTT